MVNRSLRMCQDAAWLSDEWRRRESNPRNVSPAPQLLLVPPEVSDEEGFRLASLADGEGCFVISRMGWNNPVRRPGGGSYSCSFVVKMRADDGAFLRRFAAIFGGRINTVRDNTQDGLNRAPQVTWIVSNKAGCVSLVDVFDRYPLWSKKARDYGIWREAVLYWNSLRGRRNDWAPMARFFDEIKAVRKYTEAAEGFHYSISSKSHGNRLGFPSEVPERD